MTYLLDTDVFTLAFYDTHGVRGRVAAVRPPDGVAVGLATRVEVLLGRLDAVKKAASGHDLLLMQRRLERTETFLATFPVAPFDRSAADHFDRFRADKKFPRMNRGDLLAACIALARGATLVTRNVKDYAHVPGLAVENWAS